MISNREQFQDFLAGEETGFHPGLPGGVHPGAVINIRAVFHERHNSARSENTVICVALFDGNKC